MLELFGQEEIPKRGARTWLETMLSVYHDWNHKMLAEQHKSLRFQGVIKALNEGF
jgi:hypothetical protein